MGLGVQALEEIVGGWKVALDGVGKARNAEGEVVRFLVWFGAWAVWFAGIGW